jgi:hypothetical protein
MAYERMIETFTLKVWRGPGMTAGELANQLEHCANMVCVGCQSGEIISEGHDGGWWDTTEMQEPAPAPRKRARKLDRALGRKV